MHDILPPSSVRVSPVVTQPAHTPPSKISQFLDSANHWLGKLAFLLNTPGFERGIIAHPTHIHTEHGSVAEPVKHPYARVRRTKPTEHLKVVARKTTEKVGAKTKTVKKNLKTPLGKVTAVQTLAMLGLAVLVIQTNHPSGAPATETASPTPQAIQRYLPAIPLQPVSAPLKEDTLASEGATTPLHTWVTPWNIAQVSQMQNQYTSFSAFWGTVSEDGRSINPKADYGQWASFKQSVAGSETYLTVSGDPDHTYLILTDPSVQQAFIGTVLATLRQYEFTGVDINFEALGSSNRELFTNFVRTLTTALHSENKKVAITLEARIANQVPMDWRTIGILADQVRIMAYDYHGRTTGEPGPIAPLGWVKEVVDYATQQIDSSKIIVGLGNYGYDWTEPAEGNQSWEGVGLSHEKAMLLAEQYGTPVVRSAGLDERGYDIGSIPTLQYRDENQALHSVWFEDSESITQKIDLLDQYHLKGVIFWSVGLGDTQFWTSRSTNAYTSNSIK